MYDLDNLNEEMKKYLGADDPKYDAREAFTIFEIADLKFDFRPDPEDDIFPEKRKLECYEKIHAYEEKIKYSILSKSFKNKGISEFNGDFYLTRQAIVSWFAVNNEKCPEVFKPKSEENSLPSYLDYTHTNYCPELKLAIDVCEEIYINANPTSRSIGKRVERYLENNYELKNGPNTRLPDAFIKRIMAVCTAKKTKYKKIESGK